MKVLTAAEMREADRRTIEELGLPGAVLMETAAMRVVEAVRSFLSPPRRIVVVAGPGNNGGDGAAAARQLHAAGYTVSLWAAALPEDYRGDAAINFSFLKHSGVAVRLLPAEKDLLDFARDLHEADLVIDALLGVGLSRPVEGLFKEIVDLINSAGTPVLAVDLPSGVCADSGRILGTAVRARWTVTFAFPKRGHLLYPGAELAGEVLVGDIFIPAFLVEQSCLELLTAGFVSSLLPPRPPDKHKAAFGRVLMAAGSAGMSGAAALAGEAALRGGAGLVYLFAPEEVLPALESRVTTEVITRRLPAGAEAAAERLLEEAGQCNVLAAGPGMDPGEETLRLLSCLAPRCPVPVVLDAGALTALAADPSLLRRFRRPPVITPHPGEMARLAGMKTEEVQADRVETTRRFAVKWGCYLVLKGAYTLIGTPEGRVFVNPTGNPALATAGAGDVLTGLIAALIAQGAEPLHAALAGVFIHGLAGDLSPYRRGMIAGDISSLLKEAFRFMETTKGSSPSLPHFPFLQPLRPFCR